MESSVLNMLSVNLSNSVLWEPTNVLSLPLFTPVPIVLSNTERVSLKPIQNINFAEEDKLQQSLQDSLQKSLQDSLQQSLQDSLQQSLQYITQNSSNDSISSGDLPLDMQFNEGHVLLITCYTAIMVVSLVGNLWVLRTILDGSRKHRKSRVNFMLLHLALADLIVS